MGTATNSSNYIRAEVSERVARIRSTQGTGVRPTSSKPTQKISEDQVGIAEDQARIERVRSRALPDTFKPWLERSGEGEKDSEGGACVWYIKPKPEDPEGHDRYDSLNQFEASLLGLFDHPSLRFTAPEKMFAFRWRMPLYVTACLMANRPVPVLRSRSLSEGPELWPRLYPREFACFKYEGDEAATDGVSPKYQKAKEAIASGDLQCPEVRSLTAQEILALHWGISMEVVPEIILLLKKILNGRPLLKDDDRQDDAKDKRDKAFLNDPWFSAKPTFIDSRNGPAKKEEKLTNKEVFIRILIAAGRFDHPALKDLSTEEILTHYWVDNRTLLREDLKVIEQVLAPGKRLFLKKAPRINPALEESHEKSRSLTLERLMELGLDDHPWFFSSLVRHPELWAKLAGVPNEVIEASRAGGAINVDPKYTALLAQIFPNVHPRFLRVINPEGQKRQATTVQLEAMKKRKFEASACGDLSVQECMAAVWGVSDDIAGTEIKILLRIIADRPLYEEPDKASWRDNLPSDAEIERRELIRDGKFKNPKLAGVSAEKILAVFWGIVGLSAKEELERFMRILEGRKTFKDKDDGKHERVLSRKQRKTMAAEIAEEVEGTVIAEPDSLYDRRPSFKVAGLELKPLDSSGPSVRVASTPSIEGLEGFEPLRRRVQGAEGSKERALIIPHIPRRYLVPGSIGAIAAAAAVAVFLAIGTKTTDDKKEAEVRNRDEIALQENIVKTREQVRKVKVIAEIRKNVGEIEDSLKLLKFGKKLYGSMDELEGAFRESVAGARDFESASISTGQVLRVDGFNFNNRFANTPAFGEIKTLEGCGVYTVLPKVYPGGKTVFIDGLRYVASRVAEITVWDERKRGDKVEYVLREELTQVYDMEGEIALSLEANHFYQPINLGGNEVEEGILKDYSVFEDGRETLNMALYTLKGGFVSAGRIVRDKKGRIIKS